MEKPELIIFTGNVGCGKSTMAARLAKKGYVIVNMDAIIKMVQGGDYGAYDPKLKPVYREIERGGIITALCFKIPVVVDRTNMKISDRARYVEMGKNAAARVSSCCWGAGDPIGLKRRLEHPKGILKEKWREIFDYMAGSYEEPRLEEGFSSIHFYNIYGEVIDEFKETNFIA